LLGVILGRNAAAEQRVDEAHVLDMVPVPAAAAVLLRLRRRAA
jgi:hypothetical protein